MKAYEVSQKDPTTTTERKTVMLIKKLGTAEETIGNAMPISYKGTL
jgi:hypothetical protein